LVVHFGEVANGKPIYHGAQVDGESDAAEGTGKGYEMKTRYQLLRDAGDTLDTLIKQLVVLRETGLAIEAEQLQNRLSEQAEECWKSEYAEPDLEEVA
jgi:hypothetical protein